jgi:hypothetical protein
MKSFSYLLLVCLVLSCNGRNEQKSKVSEQICLDSLNSIFAEISFAEKHYWFTGFNESKPIFENDFYSDDDLKNLIFFTLFNDSVELVICVDTSISEGPSIVRFIEPIGNNAYIDFSSGLNANLSFLKYCGYKLIDYDMHIENYFTMNIGDTRIEGTWVANPNNINRNSILKINADQIEIDGGSKFSYEKKGKMILNRLTQSTIFKIVAYSSKKMLVQFMQSHEAQILVYEKSES